MPADVVEKALFDLIVPHLTQRLGSAFEAGFIRVLELINEKQDNNRARIDDRIRQLREQEDALLDDALKTSFSAEAIRARTEPIHLELAACRSNRAQLPHISIDAIDFDGTRETLQDGFELIRDRIPFIPASEEEAGFVAALRSVVLKIELSHSERSRGRIGLKVEVQFERLFLTDVELAACPFAPVTLETEFVVPLFYYAGSMERMSELAAKGLHSVTDAQWALLAPRLPDLRRTDHNGDRPTETRTVLNCLLFLLRTDMPISAVPPHFGDKVLVYNAIQRLISAGGLETLAAVFNEHDPAFLEGLNLERLVNRRRADQYSKVARVAIRPVETAARLAEEQRYALTDVQWQAIRHLFDSRIECPTGRDARPISCRTAMEGILVKLATHCAWSKMPDRLGGKSLLGVASMIAYHGAWSSSLKILSKSFPELIDGIDTSLMDRMPLSVEVKRRERSVAPILQAKPEEAVA